MSEIKVNTEEFKKQYPFLLKIWNLYEEFNQTIDHLDDHKVDYISMCEKIIQNVRDKQEWYKDLCKKLIRNIGTFSSEYNKAKYNFERCKNLNSWLYYIIKDYNVDEGVITNIFNQSYTTMASGINEPYCLNYSYKNKYNNPDKIIKLINLEDYMSDFLHILKNNNDDNHCSCRKFISECTKIYKDMNKDYCSIENKSHPKNADTCSQLSTFKKFYEFYINSNQDLKSKLPSLTDGTMKVIIPCESEKSGEELTNLSPEVHKPDNPIKIGTNAVLGTMAGVSSLFALSYKFTPLGKWFRPRHLRDTVGSNNIGKQAEYELFHNRPEDGNISFDQTRYNVAYTPV